jgi:hypothetical protein
LGEAAVSIFRIKVSLFREVAGGSSGCTREYVRISNGMLFIIINIILLNRFPRNNILFFTQITERVGVTVTVRTPLREMLGSYLGWDASQPDRLL